MEQLTHRRLVMMCQFVVRVKDLRHASRYENFMSHRRTISDLLYAYEEAWEVLDLLDPSTRSRYDLRCMLEESRLPWWCFFPAQALEERKWDELHKAYFRWSRQLLGIVAEWSECQTATRLLKKVLESTS